MINFDKVQNRHIILIYLWKENSMGIKSRFYVDVIALHPGVTGSNILCLVHFPYGPMVRFVVDCGLFQEQKYSNLNTTF